MLTKQEQETIILFNEEEATAAVYTHNAKLTAKLRQMAQKFPGIVFQERREHPGAVSYIVPKSCISVREPYSEARRRADSERAKAAGIRPPRRGKK